MFTTEQQQCSRKKYKQWKSLECGGAIWQGNDQRTYQWAFWTEVGCDFLYFPWVFGESIINITLLSGKCQWRDVHDLFEQAASLKLRTSSWTSTPLRLPTNILSCTVNIANSMLNVQSIHVIYRLLVIFLEITRLVSEAWSTRLISLPCTPGGACHASLYIIYN